MLDIKLLQENTAEIKKALAKKKVDPTLVDEVIQADQKHRELLTKTEKLQAEQNQIAKEIPKADPTQKPALLEKSKALKEEIAQLASSLAAAEQDVTAKIAVIPNVPHHSVPEGKDENDNLEIKKWGEPTKIEKPLDHVDLGTKLGILDFDRAAKISGARFSILKGAGAKLERVLAAFMLDHHTSKGYTEIIPPYLVNADSLFGTGQLPKFEADLFKVAHEPQPLYLIPTAEVPVTNLYRDEIIEAADLPIKHVSFTPCFRSEAGSYGKDTRGMIRQHQFHKVELVKFTTPEQAEAELETLTRNAEEILEALQLPYRRIILCGGDMGFSAHITYDLEVWIPSQNKYREISSCSWFSDFQARRAKIRYKDSKDPKAKNQLVHTLNGSGLATGRTWVAVIENYQQPDGSISIPEILRPYMGGLTVIK